MVKIKELKRKGRFCFKKHYFIFVLTCLIAAFFASEFNGSLSIFKVQSYEPIQAIIDSGNEIGLPSTKSIQPRQIVEDILIDNIQKSKEFSEQILNKENTEPTFWAGTRGVLANIINQVSSGTILVTIASAINSILRSEQAGVIVLIILGAICLFAFWFFVQNIYVIISRRIFLEGRCYQKVPLERFAFLLRVKKLLKVSWIMFVKYIFQTLWSLTIVGGIIKHYSYFLVPYIAAENPNLTARQAITLSRKMMKGHKWECFVIELSFIGWYLLGVITFGLSSIFYSHPYKVATLTEYFVYLRTQAKNAEIPGEQLLDDIYLYEKPERKVIEANYSDVIKIMQMPAKDPAELTGWRKFIADNFGVLLMRTKKEDEYEKSQALKSSMEQMFDAVSLNTYPTRLFPISEPSRRRLIQSINYLRRYSIWSLIMIYLIISIIGWVWEVSFTLVTEGMFVNRGSLYGPWLPIYGNGAILILTILSRFRKKPVVEFTLTIVLCGVVEYFTSYYMEVMSGGMRWWDYSGYFLNINGRICAEGLLVFGIGGAAIVYLLAPIIDNLIRRIDEKIFRFVCITLLIVFLIDYTYSQFRPNKGDGITDLPQHSISQKLENGRD